jgi:hypothetical protein
VVEEPDPVRNESAETAGQRGRHKERPNAESDLALGVEPGQVDGEAGEEAAFDRAEEGGGMR